MMFPIGLGTWPLGGKAYGPVAADDARAVLDGAYRAGIRCFDTADIYGDGSVEQLMGEVFAGLPDITIVTKVGYRAEASREQDFSPARMREAVGASLRRLRRDCVDVLLLHSPPLDAASEPMFAAADDLVSAGLARRAGVSLAHVDHYAALTLWPKCAAIEVIYNLTDQRAADRGVFEDCARRGRLALARLPLGNGLLAGRYPEGFRFPEGDVRARWPQAQIDRGLAARRRFLGLTRPDRTPAQLALAFCLATPGAPVPIPGAKTVQQVQENAAAAEAARGLTAEEFSSARRIWTEISDVIPG